MKVELGHLCGGLFGFSFISIFTILFFPYLADAGLSEDTAIAFFFIGMGSATMVFIVGLIFGVVLPTRKEEKKNAQ